MKISFIGSGYVGLISGAVLADVGHIITCIDYDQAKIDMLKAGISPIYEPGLDEILYKNIKSKNLNFTNIINIEIAESAAIFIAVGTPQAENGSADLIYVYAAIDAIINYILPEQIIVIKSTVPPGTTEQIIQYLMHKGITNSVVTNPEFLREGKAIKDFRYPDRIVIGAKDNKAIKIMQDIYAPLLTNEIKAVITDPTSAELIKYTANSFLALKIAFINEIANVCEDIGANIEDVAYGVGLDKRIGNKHLKAGPGFGGSCFPKDILAIAHLTKNFTEPCNIIETVIASNYRRKYLMVNKIKQALINCESTVNQPSSNSSNQPVHDLSTKTLCILGVTFKANTDDVRSSPAIEIIQILADECQISLQIYDPAGMANASKILPPKVNEKYKVQYAANVFEAATAADAIVILTEWQEFENYDYASLKAVLKHNIVIDLRNILDKSSLNEQGFKYYNIGTA